MVLTCEGEVDMKIGEILYGALYQLYIATVVITFYLSNLIDYSLELLLVSSGVI
jgi:hypothetical protein